jgi:hypothetical protein
VKKSEDDGDSVATVKVAIENRKIYGYFLHHFLCELFVVTFLKVGFVESPNCKPIVTNISLPTPHISLSPPP